MNFIKKFLMVSKNRFAHPGSVTEKQGLTTIAEGLFSENNPPTSDNIWTLGLDNEEAYTERPLNEKGITKSSNLLDQFLSKDFETKGYEDGNMKLGREIMDQAIRRQEADFRFAIDNILEVGLGQLHLIKLKQKEWEGASEAMVEEYGMRISEVERRLKFLADQKNLSVSGEGIIAPYLHAYRDGFLRGARQAAMEEEYFPGLNVSIFNK